MANSNLPNPMDILPHRPPMLYLDEITALEPDLSASGLWTPPESEYAGHFPGHPVLPGVKTVESLAQTGAIAVLANREGMLPLFTNADEVRFTAMVLPSDTIETNANIIEVNDRKAKGVGVASVSGKIVCSTNFSFVFVTEEKFFELAQRQ